MKHIAALRACLEVAHRTYSHSFKTAVLTVLIAAATGAAAATWIIAIFIIK